MYRICMITDDDFFAERINAYWLAKCGSDFELEICKEIDGVKNQDEINIILADENKIIDSGKIKVLKLVSDINKANGSTTFFKYGKPQDLYNKILEMCESGKTDVNDGIKLITHMDGKEKILNLQIDMFSADKYALDILRNCPIEGLVPIRTNDDDSTKVDYYIHGKISMKEYLNTITSDRQLIQILKDIFDILIKVEDYMLDRNQLLLDLEHIYIHQITNKPSLIYIPKKYSYEKEWLVKYQDLLTSLSQINLLEADKQNELHIKLDDKKEEKVTVRKTLNYLDKTEYFQSMQATKKNEISDSMINTPKLYWIKKKKQVTIDRKIFKIGKEKKFVDFCIDDNKAVSRNHADIITIDNEVFIIDNESLNHTFVNGKQIPSNARIQLHDKDSIRMANEDFIFTYNNKTERGLNG